MSQFNNNIKVSQNATYFSFRVVYDKKVASILARKQLHDLKRNIYIAEEYI